MSGCALIGEGENDDGVGNYTAVGDLGQQCLWMRVMAAVQKQKVASAEKAAAIAAGKHNGFSTNVGGSNMRIHKRDFQHRLMGLIWLLPLISACIGGGIIADDQVGQAIQQEQAPVDKEAAVAQSGMLILAADQDPIRESLTFLQEQVAVDLWIDQNNTAEVYVNEEPVDLDWIDEDGLAYGQLILAQEGRFQVIVVVSDPSGAMMRQETQPIIVDGKAPELKVFLDDEAITELPAYLNHEAELRWRVSDALFDEPGSVILDHGQLLPLDWERYDDYWEACMKLSGGAHQLTVNAMDEVGQQTIWTGVTIVDLKRPLVKREYTERLTYREPFTVQFFIQDENIAADEGMVSLVCDDTKYLPHVDWQRDESGIRGRLPISSSGRCSLTLRIEDQAGNPAVYQTADGELSDAFQHDFLLDQTNPQLMIEPQVTMTNQAQELVLRVRDDHLERQAISVRATHDGDALAMPLTWERQVNEWIGKAWFQEDGVYHLVITAVDMVGNPLCDSDRCGEIHYDFTLDQTAPEIELTQPSSALYRNESTPLTVSFFDRQLAAYQFTVLRNQRVFATRNGTSNDTFSFTLTQDGEYEIIGRAKDQAGNEQQLHERFILDQQPPLLQAYFDDVPAKHQQTLISNRDVTLHLTWQEPYWDKRAVRVFKNDEEMPVPTSEQGMTMTFIAESEREDTYRIEVMLKDRAGNETQAVYQLHMDTYLPPLKWAEDPFQGKPRNVFWKPRLLWENDAFHVNDVILYRNQQLMNHYHWGDTIIAEGSYLLTLSVRDEAMNEAVLLPPFAFVIDHTPPVIRIWEAQQQAELSDNYVSLASELRLYVQDAYSEEVNIHTLLFDGEPLADDRRMQDEQGNWYYPLNFQRTGDVILQVNVSDAADNHNDQTIVFHVSDQLKPSEVKTLAPKDSTAKEVTQPVHFGKVLCGVLIAMLFAFGMKRVYASK